MSTIEFFLRIILSFGLIWFILFFLILVHEYGHVAACNALKIKPERLVIGWPTVYSNVNGGLKHEFGVIPVYGYVGIENTKTLPLRDRAWLAAAGPVTSLLLGLLLLGVDWIHPLWLINLSGHASLTLAVLNLIPLPPFDGWPVLQYQLSKRGVTVSGESHRLLLACGLFAVAVSVWVVGQWGGF